jgi:hypothetical protein
MTGRIVPSGVSKLAAPPVGADDDRVASKILLSSFLDVRVALSAATLALLAGAGCGEILGLGDYSDEPGAGGAGSGGAGASTSASGGSAATSSTASGGASATSSSASASGGGGAGPDCGNDMLDAQEECDDGADNGPGKACKGDCTLNVCGDGDVGPDENCDEGVDNGLGLLKCAPDCSRVIVQKQITISTNQPNGSFGGVNPVAFADSHCPVGSKALFAFGNLRRATTVGNQVTNPVDWVLTPYTYYYNEDSNPIWLTDAVALLGVRNGAFTELENPVRPDVTENSLSGLNGDWTTLGTDNCNGWNSISSGSNKSQGWTFATDLSFIVDASLGSCSYEGVFYCVEQ